MYKDYIILSKSWMNELEKTVREYMSQGWTPLGGIAVASKDNGTIDSYVQAMVLPYREHEKSYVQRLG